MKISHAFSVANLKTSQFICFFFPGKAVKMIKLKTNRLEMYEKPLPNLQGITEANITCSSYGDPNEMSGQITRIDGSTRTSVRVVISKTENLFSVKAVANKTGTYSCSTKFKGEETKTYTYVKSMYTA